MMYSYKLTAVAPPFRWTSFNVHQLIMRFGIEHVAEQTQFRTKGQGNPRFAEPGYEAMKLLFEFLRF